MLKVETDLSFADKLTGAGEKLAAAIETGLDRGADITVRAMDKQIGKTYARSIPRRKSGKPKWQRSGDLAKSLDIKKSKGERSIVSTGPAAAPIKNYPGGYAEKLRSLPVSSDGVNRRNDYPANAAKIIEPQVQRAVEQEIKNALGM